MQYITAYNYDWSKRFVQIATHVKQFIPDNCMLHHIGSTSVPGMPAKDIIDLDIEYVPGSLQTVIGGLKKAGYEHEGDLGIPGREAFKPIPNSHASSLPTHHLYACENGAFELQRHLAYRDYLLVHPERAEWFSSMKLLVDASANSRDEYIENKSRYYEPIIKEAMVWANKAMHTD